MVIKVLPIAQSLQRHVFEFFWYSDVVWVRGGGVLGIVVGEVVVIGGDVGGGDWEGDVEAVGSLVEGVVVVRVVVLLLLG